MALGELALLFSAVELPEAQGNQQRQQHDREQRRTPFEVEAQGRHGARSAPGKAGRVSQGEPLYSLKVLTGEAVGLKVLIVILMVLLVASLAGGAYFLMIDQGDRTRRRTLNSLGVRLGLAISLMGLIIYGVASGQLGHRNPWDGSPIPASGEEPSGAPPAAESR